MKVTTWTFAFLASVLPAFATDENANWGAGSADDIVKAWDDGKGKDDWNGGNPWAVANPYISKPETYTKGSVSPDGTCGGSTGYTCKGSAWGDCCGKNGWCGSTEDYCGAGCNKAFGECGVVSSSKSPVASTLSFKKARVTVTSTRKVSTTVCPTTMVFTTSTVESDSTIVSAATITTTVPYSTHTVTEHPSDYSSGSPGAPSSYPGDNTESSSDESPVSTSSSEPVSSSTTVYTTVFTTAHPATYTITEGTSTAIRTTTISETHTSVVTIIISISPTSSGSSETTPAGPTNYPTTSGKPTVTEYVTSYTTKCPVTQTITSDGTTSITTYTTISTVTSTVSSTITSSASQSTPTTVGNTSPSEYTIVSSTPIYRSDSCFTTTINGTVTTISRTTSATGTGPTGSLPVNATTSGNGQPSHAYTIVSSTPIYRSGSCFTTTINGTVTTISSTAASTGFGSVTTGNASTPTTGSVSSSVTASSSTFYPGGNGTTVGPTGSGTVSHHSSYSIVSSYPIYRSGSCFTTTNSSFPHNSTSTVGPIGTGSSLTSGSASQTPSNSINGTTSSTRPPIGTGSSLTSGTASQTPSNSINGTASSTRPPLGTGTASFPTNSGNATITAGPTGTGTQPPFGTGTGFPTNSANATTAHSNHTSTSTCRSKPTHTDFCVPCQGQPGNDPKAWCGYDVNTDNYQYTPKTCATVEYHLTITNETIAPDGVERIGLLINGQFPGPAIEANWGDTIIVHLTNAMQDNGTSLHFHGMRQFGSNEMDGVPSVTQCALAPGDSMTYKFVATNYGTSWYHSHWGLQTFDGVFGPLIIHGPSSKEYDVDAGPIVLSDWNHISVNEIYESIQQVTSRPGAPTLDTGLINGMNVWENGGKRFEMEFESGKAYMLRLVNCAIQATFKFSIDGHKFWVVSTDFVPIKPYLTETLTINIGQRYNVIVVADQTPSAYWMRADNQLSCSPMTQYNNIKAIVRYKDANQGLLPGLVSNLTSNLPLTLPNPSAVQGSCADEPAASLIPIVAHTVGPQTDNIHENVLIGPGPSTPNLYKWILNGATFQSHWGDPTLNRILDNGTVPDYSGELAIEVPNLGEWVYIIIETPIPVPHPIHLHGHDFYVLASGVGPWDGNTGVFQLDNPPRRDVAMMPGGAGPGGAGGHLVLAFYTDNPGAWLMHCHIGWHQQMGFALQIVENLEGIKKMEVDTCKMQNTCKNWHSYTKQAGIFTMPDSGI